MADLQVTVGGNKSGFSQTLAGVRAEAKAFASELGKTASTGWAAFSPAGLAGTIGAWLSWDTLKGHIKGIFEYGNQLVDLSEQFDISTDSVQRWDMATAKASMTMGVFTKALDKLRQTREAALSDSTKMGVFTRLGISEADVAGLKDVDLLRAVLESPASRPLKGQAIGMRNVRLVAALEKYKELAGQTMPFSGDDLEKLHELEQELRAANIQVRKWSLDRGPFRFYMAWAKLVTKGGLKAFMEESNRMAQIIGGTKGNEWTGGVGHFGGPNETPEDEKKVKAEVAWFEEEWAAGKKANEDYIKSEDKLREVMRAGMPEWRKRNDLIAEQFIIMERVADLEKNKFLDPTERRTQINEELAKFAGIDNELYKPSKFTFSPDPLARIGGFTTSSVSGGSVDLLQQILRELGRFNNKFD